MTTEFNFKTELQYSDGTWQATITAKFDSGGSSCAHGWGETPSEAASEAMKRIVSSMVVHQKL